MDRNILLILSIILLIMSLSARRAWIEIPHTLHDFPAPKSLSARRAWIEIVCCVVFCSGAKVALRKESVDRNALHVSGGGLLSSSLSARRAWIEMVYH